MLLVFILRIGILCDRKLSNRTL